MIVLKASKYLLTGCKKSQLFLIVASIWDDWVPLDKFGKPNINSKPFPLSHRRWFMLVSD